MSSQGFQQVQRQTQTMVLAPQLRQSLKILQVSALELRNVILEELQINPTLEELAMDGISIDAPDATNDSGDAGDSAEDPVDDGSPTDEERSMERNAPGEEPGESASGESEMGEPREPSPESGPAEDVDDFSERADPAAEDRLSFDEDFGVLQKLDDDWADLMHQEAGEIPYTTEDAERRQHFFDSLTGETSLQQHLLEQARLQETHPQILEALEYLVGSLDANGFIPSPLADIALQSTLPLKRIQEAAKLLKSLEPVGIGAENVRECLLLQLQATRKGQGLAGRIVRDHWELLLRRRIPDLARKLGVHVDDIQAAIAEIGQLDPAPGRRFSEDTNRVVEADVRVEKDDAGEWQIILNSDYIPRLRISSAYKEMLAKGVLRGKDREYLQEKIRSGKFLISSIEQRQQTIERITRQLLRFQRDFFDGGSSKLHPLTMAQVAAEVGVHETTVSRAIANKYLACPHGIYEFKYFFTTGYQGEDGSAVSNTSVKERIAKIIGDEPPAKPYSDQQVVALLKQEGLSIARRTVAKYREELGILPTNLRRQYK